MEAQLDYYYMHLVFECQEQWACSGQQELGAQVLHFTV